MEEPESNSNVGLHSDVSNGKLHCGRRSVWNPIQRGLGEWIDGFGFDVNDVEASPPARDLSSDWDGVWNTSAKQIVASNWYCKSKYMVY